MPLVVIAWQLTLILVTMNFLLAGFLQVPAHPHWITITLLILVNLYVWYRYYPDLKKGYFITIYEDRIVTDVGMGRQTIPVGEIDTVLKGNAPGSVSSIRLKNGEEKRIPGPGKYFLTAWQWLYDHYPTNMSSRP